MTQTSSQTGGSRRLAELRDLGSRLLVGQGVPQDPARGVCLLQEAAGLGNAEAAVILATLSAAGAWTPQSWDLALARLEQGAGLGSRRAECQLILFSGGDPSSGARWARPEGGVDLSRWFAPSARQVICETPRVRASPAFVPPPVCDWLIAQVKGRMRQALMYHGDVKREVLDPHRSCSDFEFNIADSDCVLIMVRQRIAALTGLPTAAMEPPRVFHYALGQDIKPHYDRLSDGIGGYGGGDYEGDRIVTFLLYLNDGFEGGELDFPKVNRRYKGGKGDAVYFAHVNEVGAPEPLSLHAGLPILRGEKYVLSQWIHDRPLIQGKNGGQ